MHRLRRSIVLGTVALPAVGRAAGQARRYALLSLVGNRIEIVDARPEIGSRLSQNRRRFFDDVEGTLDRLVAQAVAAAVNKEGRGAPLSMLALPGSALYDQPERAFDGRQVVLPGSVVDALEAGKFSHLLLVTKVRDAVRLPLYDSTAGVGAVQGIGFYVDPDLRLRIVETGHAGFGVLAPFVYVRISLVDVASGEVMRDEVLREVRTYATAEKPDAVNPWEVLSAEQKLEALRQLIQKSIGDAALRLLSGG